LSIYPPVNTGVKEQYRLREHRASGPNLTLGV
jgi:hypothetical protein